MRIEETKAENTGTPLRIDVLTRINFRADGHLARAVTWLYVIAQAYSSNLLVADHQAIFVGDVVTGEIGGNYSGSGRAHLSAWKPSDLDAWRSLAPRALLGEQYGDFEERDAEWSLALGGAAFAGDSPGGNRILAVRMFPPGRRPPHHYPRTPRADQ